MSSLDTGLYQHYKGKQYLVIGVAKHSETLEDLVVYIPRYESSSAIWVRPLSMFLESVVVDGQSVPRFQKLAAGGL